MEREEGVRRGWDRVGLRRWREWCRCEGCVRALFRRDIAGANATDVGGSMRRVSMHRRLKTILPIACIDLVPFCLISILFLCLRLDLISLCGYVSKSLFVQY